jgi:hypothetical protein
MPRGNSAAAPSPVDGAGFWQYTGDVERLYAAVPVTVRPGDVVAHPDGPPAADGLWKPHPGPATRAPDNAPQLPVALPAATPSPSKE